MNKIEVCFSPLQYNLFHKPDSAVVIVDILRATTAICTAFINKAEKIIPVETLEEAKQYKEKGFMVAAERDGKKIDFADIGNSPFNFTRERVEGKTIVYSTTNGTQCINMTSDCHTVCFGSFLNIDIIASFLAEKKKDIVVLCAGWKGKFNIEDALFAGALTQKLLNIHEFSTDCDSTYVAIDIWTLAESDPLLYMEKAAHFERLRKNNLDDVVEYCFTPNICSVIPIIKNKHIEALTFI